MAWMSQTYEGLRVEQLGDALCEFCVAVNERQAALGQTETEWWLPDQVSKKTNPSKADFDGFPLLSAKGIPYYGSRFVDNIILLRSGITKLVDAVFEVTFSCTCDEYWNSTRIHYTNGPYTIAVLRGTFIKKGNGDNGILDVWENGGAYGTPGNEIYEILALGTFGNSWVLPTHQNLSDHLNDSRIYQQIREVLDQITWIAYFFASADQGASLMPLYKFLVNGVEYGWIEDALHDSGWGDIPEYATLEAAWDARNGGNWGPSAVLSRGYSAIGGYPSGPYRAFDRRGGKWTDPTNLTAVLPEFFTKLSKVDVGAILTTWPTYGQAHALWISESSASAYIEATGSYSCPSDLSNGGTCRWNIVMFDLELSIPDIADAPFTEPDPPGVMGQCVLWPRGPVGPTAAQKHVSTQIWRYIGNLLTYG